MRIWIRNENTSNGGGKERATGKTNFALANVFIALILTFFSFYAENDYVETSKRWCVVRFGSDKSIDRREQRERENY